MDCAESDSKNVSETEVQEIHIEESEPEKIFDYDIPSPVFYESDDVEDIKVEFDPEEIMSEEVANDTSGDLGVALPSHKTESGIPEGNSTAKWTKVRVSARRQYDTCWYWSI